MVEEVFDEKAQKYFSKTIYRDFGDRQASDDRIEKARQAIRERTPKPATVKPVTRVSRKKKPQRAAASKSTGLYWAVGIIAFIALLGGGVVALI